MGELKIFNHSSAPSSPMRDVPPNVGLLIRSNNIFWFGKQAKIENGEGKDWIKNHKFVIINEKVIYE